MNHHQEVFDCLSCQDKLKQAHAELGKWFWEMKKNFPVLHISWSFRGEKEQQECFAQGKSKLQWPKSPHNHEVDGNACSLALDLFQLKDGKAYWPAPLFNLVDHYNTENKFPIKWGGHFKSLGDFDHFQLIFPF